VQFGKKIPMWLSVPPLKKRVILPVALSSDQGHFATTM
jgi:hypothetical protein